MKLDTKTQIDSIIEDHLYDRDHEDETPYEFIAEVCYRFFNLHPEYDFKIQSDIEEYVLIQLRNLLDTDYDLNLYRLRKSPLKLKQNYDF